MLSDDRMAVSKILTYVHDRVPATNFNTSINSTDVTPMNTVFRLLCTLARVGAGALQIVKGNVFFPILLAMNSNDDGVRNRGYFYHSYV